MNNYTSIENLAKWNGTDKLDHGYMPLYGALFEPFRFDPVRILEIGFAKGRGARMLAEYFPRGIIHCLDYQRSKVVPYLDNILSKDVKDRIFVWQCDQSQKEDLESAIKDIIRSSKSPNIQFQVIIDDGSHVPEHQILSFETLFPYVMGGGYYAIEDMHLAYVDGQHKTVEYFHSLVNQINTNRHSSNPDISRPDIECIMFTSNRIIVRKSDVT